MVQPTHPSRIWHPAERMPARIPNDPIYESRVPMDICTMFDEYCNIPLKHFIMAGIRDDGQLVRFTGPKEAATSEVLSKYIDLDGYQKWYTTGRVMPTPSPSYEESYPAHGDPGRPHMSSAYGGRRQYDRRRGQGLSSYDDEACYRTRKRQRGTFSGRRDIALDDELPAVQVVLSKKGIRVGNKDEVWKFCDQRFKNIQQTACKLIAKAWVKLIAPKKQSNHPYTGADAKAPDWWPKPWGTSRDEKVRHKEPDHLYKPERVYLLNHILHMITEPNHLQHKDIQKHGLNVSKLEEATFEALGSFFGDSENPNNAKKKPYLREIFKVARYEERYKNGEIDADCECMVMAEDKVPDNYQSDDDEDDIPKDDDDSEQNPTPANDPTSKTADHGLLVAPSSEHSPASNLPGGPFLGDLPVRGPQYHHQSSMMQADLSSGHPNFVEGSSMGTQSTIQQAGAMPLQENFPDPHAPSRRPSLYASPSEYGSATTSGLYPSWQGTNPPTTPSMYSSFDNQQQQAHQSGSYVHQQPVPLAQTPQYVEAAPFDNMQRGSYDTGAASIYRTASVPQGSVHSHPTQSFPNYLPQQHDPRSLSGPSLKIESMPRGQLHDEGGSSFEYGGNKNHSKRWNT